MLGLVFNLLNFLKVDYRKFNRVFPFVLVLGFIYIFSWITEDIPYFSDYEIRTEGNITTTPFGSILLSLLCFKFNLNLFQSNLIFSTGPLNQIISLIFLCFCSTVFCLSFSDLRSRLQNILISFSFIANPLLLHAFSFTTECIVPLSAVGLSLLAAIETSSKKFNIVFGMFLVFLICGLSYIHISTFVGAVFLIFLIKAKDQIKSAFLYLLDSFLKLSLGITISQLFFSKYGNTIIFRLQNLDADFKTRVFETASIINERIISHFFHSKILISIIVIGIIIFCIKYILESKHKTLHTLICCFSTLIIFLSPTALQLILKYPEIYPQNFSAVSIILILFYYSFFKTSYKFIPLSKLVILAITFHFFYFSYGLAAILRAQYNFNHEISSTIINQLYRNGFNQDDSIILTGYLGTPRVVDNSRMKDPSFYAFHTSDIGGERLAPSFFKYIGLKAKYISTSVENNHQLSYLCRTELLVDTHNFKIYKSPENIYLIALTYNDCNQFKPND
jgi:hypothetical protein